MVGGQSEGRLPGAGPFRVPVCNSWVWRSRERRLRRRAQEVERSRGKRRMAGGSEGRGGQKRAGWKALGSLLSAGRAEGMGDKEMGGAGPGLACVAPVGGGATGPQLRAEGGIEASLGNRPKGRVSGGVRPAWSEGQTAGPHVPAHQEEGASDGLDHPQASWWWWGGVTTLCPPDLSQSGVSQRRHCWHWGPGNSSWQRLSRAL